MPPDGRDAIDAALDALYPTQLDHRFAGAKRADGQTPSVIEFAVFASEGEPSCWHYVTYGLSEIFGKETSDPDVSGYGIELTFRLRRSGESAPPHWPLQMLTTAADYIYETGNVIKPTHVLVLPGRLSLDPCKDLAFLFFVSDTALPPVQSVNGRVAFVQAVGITADEEDLIARWDACKVQAALAEGNPLLMTDPSRPSLLADPRRREELRTQASAEGSMRELEFLPALVVNAEPGMNRPVILRVDETCSRVLARALQSRVVCRRELRVKAPGSHCTSSPPPTPTNRGRPSRPKR